VADAPVGARHHGHRLLGPPRPARTNVSHRNRPGAASRTKNGSSLEKRD
jgi:hypothetical protein